MPCLPRCGFADFDEIIGDSYPEDMEGGRKIPCPICGKADLTLSLASKGVEIYLCQLCGTTLSVPRGASEDVPRRKTPR